MKKSFGIVALLSCVLLTGCSFEDLKFWEKIDFEKLMFWKKDADGQQKEDEGGENQDTPPTPVVEKKITIDALPKTVVGSELDLDQYVKCEGGNGSYTVEVSEESNEFAGLDLSGKKLMAEHSGEVSFKINYDGISKEATASFVSEEYVKFIADTKDIGYAYGIYGTDDEGYLSSYTNFGENYYYEAFENEGMVELNGKVYSFGFSGEGETYEDLDIFYSLTGNEPESLEGYVSPFFINEDILKCVYVPAEGRQEAQEILVIDDHDAVAKICEIYFGYSAELVEQHYKLLDVEIYEDALEDNEGNKYPVYDLILFIEVEEDNGGTGIYYLGWNLLNVSEEANEVAFLNEKFKTEVPHGQDASEFFALIDQAIGTQNFTVEYEAGWVTYDDQGEPVVLDSNPFMTPETEEIGYYVNHYLMATEVLTAYVTESQTYIENGEAAYSEGLVAHDGQVYFYGGEEYKAEVISTASSIFDEELRGETHNYLFLTTNEGDSLFESAFINDVFNDQYGTGFTVGGDAVDELFGDLFYFSVPVPAEMEELKDDYEEIQQYNDIFYTASFLYEEEFAKYMLCEVDFYFDGEALEGILFNFIWEDDDEEGNEYDYVMSAYVYNFGQTEIPAEVVVSYPAE